MRRWGTLVVAVGTCLGAAAESPATLALWPQQLDAELIVSHDAGGASVVKAPRGGAFGTFSMKADAESEVLLDPFIEAIQMTWVPATDAHSSVFDRYLAGSPRFDKINAVGIHLEVTLRNEASWGLINATHHEQIEHNVHQILQSTLPTLEILPSLTKGYLAKSLCGFDTWMTSDPLEEMISRNAPVFPSLCYSASFPLPSMNETTSFISDFSRAVDDGSAKSALELAVLEAWPSFQREHKFASVQLVRGSAPSVNIKAEYFEAWVARSSNAEQPWKTDLSVSEVQRDVFVVMSIAQEVNFDKLQYTLLQQAGKPVEAWSPHQQEIQSAAIPPLVQTNIAGAGFHRRYVMDVKIPSNACGKKSASKAIIVRVPIASTAYLDLDEIRRMERFGELKLLSFTKHIEIERPSPISSQHVVGLEFNVPSSGEVHVEFPIHFRYQAPSESNLYREASVIAPDVFLDCQRKGQSNQSAPKLPKDAATQKYFQTWGLLRSEGEATLSNRWLRLTTGSPLPVSKVLIPVGYLPSDWLVSSMTLLCASLGAALLLWVSVGVANRAQSARGSTGASWEGKVE